jgi:large subunit ribosomal protein L29
MDAQDIKELRQFSEAELKNRVAQWKEELFRFKFKANSGETKNTSIAKKLRVSVARALTVLKEKQVSLESSK